MLYRPGEVGPQLLRAAQYVRMSTEHLRYSIENQKQAIDEYAHQHGMMLVRTYADSGISGLRSKNRPGLQSLLDDVIARRADYQVILVLDISRWGRFQDADESAAYEFMCRKAGLRVVYCAEPFPADLGPLASLFKSLKRSMAAEYSRELSTKVFRGQSTIAARGYWVGAPAGYGLRRAIVGEDGRLKAILQAGQHKSLSTERIVLVPGPPEEVEAVRLMFQLYVFRTLAERDRWRAE
jgi:DNA invertase Pin-like site-specific DNA recombinase